MDVGVPGAYNYSQLSSFVARCQKIKIENAGGRVWSERRMIHSELWLNLRCTEVLCDMHPKISVAYLNVLFSVLSFLEGTAVSDTVNYCLFMQIFYFLAQDSSDSSYSHIFSSFSFITSFAHTNIGVPENSTSSHYSTFSKYSVVDALESLFMAIYSYF